VIILAFTFRYTGVGALVPAGVPLFAVTVIWAALGVAGYAACLHRTGRSLASAWALPAGRWPALLAVVALAAVTAANVWPPAHRSHIDLVRITIIGVVGEEVYSAVWSGMPRRPPQGVSAGGRTLGR
jgi:hypothetical protein